jgi:hypothetical protein
MLDKEEFLGDIQINLDGETIKPKMRSQFIRQTFKFFNQDLHANDLEKLE